MFFYKSEQKMVDALPIGACVFSVNNTLIAINDPMLAILGLPESAGSNLTELLASHPQQAFLEQLNQVFKTGKTYQNQEGELRLLQNGQTSVKYLNYSFKPLPDPSGEIYAVIATAIDITRQVTDRRKLQETEQRQAFLLKLSDALRPLAKPAAIQTEAARILGEYLKVSRVGYGDVDAAEQRWFKTENNWTDGTVLPHHGTHDLAGFGPAILSNLRSGRPLVIDDMLEDPRTAAPDMQAAFHALQFRSVITVSLLKEDRFVAALYVHDRNPRKWTKEEVALVQEVAERTWSAAQHVYAEESLRRSEEKFRTIFDSIDEGFSIREIIYDEQGNPTDMRYLLTNSAYGRLTGIIDAVGKTVKEMVEDIEPYWVETYGRIIKTGEPLRFENYFGKQGRWFNVYASRIGDSSSKQVAVVFNDITERKRNEQRKNDFISMVSHELKTPLTSIKAHLQLLNRSIQKSGQDFTAGAIDKSLLQVEKMQKLIQSFLDVARLEEGKIYLNYETFDLGELLAETIDDLLLSTSTHQISFELPEAIMISGDRDKLGQVVNNLISNAIKYSAKGSRITIACKASQQIAKVSVSDQGIGISAENIDKLFDRFYRVEDRQIQHISGFGIGLYLSSEIIKLHKGRIGVHSTEGDGSTFWFSLPLSATVEESESTPGSSQPGD